MEAGKVRTLALVFIGTLLLVAVAWWIRERSRHDARIDACVRMLGETAKERCEAIEARRGGD